MTKISISNICTWTGAGIGTKVLDPATIMSMLTARLDAGEVSFDEFGHGFVPCPELAGAVSCGVGLHTDNPEDYVLRSYRGQVSAYLRRDWAATADFVAVVLYTAEAYMSDPDVTRAEQDRITSEGATHVIVVVLASAGPKAPVAPRRFVANLAGGNPEWGTFDKAKLVELAVEATSYHDKWCTVAD